ncbi:hypothetical protein FHS27_002737 [Rhodopirellula rubra]|uniref:Uncharacterized protein n=1 Tax=Aporhodopirellula rubra TaxID=980271 RepID=A0A7W5DZF8_9BACT|nr:hypothetical protein [Aporhodopirellula rubra]
MSQLRVNRNSEEFFKKFSSVFRFENHNWEAAGAVKLAAVSLLRVEKNSDPSPEVKFNSKQSLNCFSQPFRPLIPVCFMDVATVIETVDSAHEN